MQLLHRSFEIAGKEQILIKLLSQSFIPFKGDGLILDAGPVCSHQNKQN